MLVLAPLTLGSRPLFLIGGLRHNKRTKDIVSCEAKMTIYMT